jgi:Tfp pilus assembly protein PilN
MGLVLKKTTPTNGSGLLVNELNVLPVAYQPEPISLTRILVVPSAVVAISLLLFLALMIQNTAADTAEMQSQLDTTNQLLQQKMGQKQKYTDAIAGLQQKIKGAETSGGNFALAVSNLETQSEAMNGNLEITVNSLPETVSLTGISQTHNSMALRGQAQSEEDILSYLRELEASERFSSITITSLSITSDGNINFNVVLNVGG